MSETMDRPVSGLRKGARGARRFRGVVSAVIGLLAVSALMAPASAAAASTPGTYHNPLSITSSQGDVQSCADPSVTKATNANGSWTWYMYCTTDPLNNSDKDGGNFHFHRIPMFSSRDLVHWRYRGDVFSGSNAPAWADPTAGFWAPDIIHANGKWYLYYTVTDVTDSVSGENGCHGDSAIGVATSASPLGPWTDSGKQTVAPRRGGPGCNFFWTYDPEVVSSGGSSYIAFGSYYGGIHLRQLKANLTESKPETNEQIAVANKYEGAELVRRGGYWYLFVSATNCCNGPLTGYSVFVGRSASIHGPFVDRSGVSLLEQDDTNTGHPDPTDGRVGGSVFLTMNGNRWVGTGHNTVFQAADGRFWTIYHAVDRNDPYFAGTSDFTRRPALMDPVVWVNGWPTANGGRWASDETMAAPAAQPGQQDNFQPMSAWRSEKGALMAAYSDEFSGSSLGSQWSWVREPASGTYGVSDGAFHMQTQHADLYQELNTASVLVENAPAGEWLLEARVRLTVPAEGCCYNFRQAGLVIYGNDDKFLKLVHFANWETRQTEWAKEVPDATPGPRYGNTIVGPPGEWTTLRIVKANFRGGTFFQAWTKRDNGVWERGGTWRYDGLNGNVKIGIVSMGAGGPADQDIVTEAQIDWVHVYHLHVRGPVPIHER